MNAATTEIIARAVIRHPEIGDILLDFDILIIPRADLRVVTYTAATGSSDAGKLDLLRVTGDPTATGQPVARGLPG